MAQHPIERFRDTLARAEKSGGALPNATSLATADERGQPSVRVVLLKGVDDDGFVFYTNLRSRKSRELDKNPKAALCFWWPDLEEQVRVEGVVSPVTDAEANAYFASRDRGSQVGAWVSRQSEELASFAELEKSYKALSESYENRKIPRPSHWSGFRLMPERIEFWQGKPHRLHERTLYARQGDHWKASLLYP